MFFKNLNTKKKLSPAATDFLTRPLDSYDWMKELTHKELNEMLREIEVTPKFNKKLWLHQKVCFLIGYYHRQFLYFLDMGTGKSAIALNLLKQDKREGKNKHCLYLVPEIINIADFEEQILTHAPQLTYTLVTGTNEEKYEKLFSDTDLVVINYMGLVHALCDRVKIGTSNKHELKPNDKKLRKATNHFGEVICDESQALSNTSSLTYRCVSGVRKKLTRRHAMTGTPFGKDPEHLWTQFRVIDEGETLGPHKNLFREVFFNERANPFSRYPTYEVDDQQLDLLYQVLKNRSISYTSEECVDVPKATRIAKLYKLPPENRAYYNEARSRTNTKGAETKQRKNSFIQQRFITSGYTTHVAEDGTKIKLDLPHNPKLDGLHALLDTIPEDSKAIIFYTYTHTAKMIIDSLSKKKKGIVWISGKDKNKRALLADFKKSKDKHYLLIQEKIGSTGLNLQVANYMFFYESPVDPKRRRQAEKRIERAGQKKKCFIYDLLIENSVDVDIRAMHKVGKNLHQQLIIGKKVK